MTIVIATLSAISINFVMLYFFIFVILYVLDSVVYFYVFSDATLEIVRPYYRTDFVSLRTANRLVQVL